MTLENEYQQDLAIDPHSLEEEWLEQAPKFMKYSVLAAKAQREHDEAKEGIDIVRAQLDSEIRQNPASFGCPKDKSGEPKTTEGWISSTIILQERYTAATQRLNQAKFDLNILTAAVRAFDHRKKALEMEVQLWVSGYWAGPSEKKLIAAGKRILAEATAQTTEKQREQLDNAQQQVRRRRS